MSSWSAVLMQSSVASIVSVGHRELKNDKHKTPDVISESSARAQERNQIAEVPTNGDSSSNPFLTLSSGLGIVASGGVLGVFYALVQKESKNGVDTLYIMSLDDEYQRAKEVVGGLLSAYDLSRENVFLEHAKDIADRLLPAWDTPSEITYNIINLERGSALLQKGQGQYGKSCYEKGPVL
ncbi:hypothetical protein L2E82_15079 [Cichorium intybus]|uniref:Uncharacterized protein n=1 Tax=Cichorium intybus TaxID=13427 RepID=A0ACB9F281_CICIN|nr:hypothetical protein L2E82_15079 [Cichorium intybus]